MTFLLLGVLFALIAWGVSLSVITAAIAYPVGVVIAYVFLPTMSWGHAGVLVYPASAVLFGCIGLAASHGGGPPRLTRWWPSPWLIASTTVGGAVLLALVTTWGAFHDSDYRALLDVTEREFVAEDVLLDQDQARFVDQALARRAGNELLGNELGLGSRIDVGTPNIQGLDGTLRWVAPFEHSGLWRWAFNQATPGYVDVSSTDYSDAAIEQDAQITIGPKRFYFGDNLHRHIYRNGYATQGLGKAVFQVDDSGHPHWVVPKRSPRVGFGGHMVDGVLIVDATTREIADYALEDVPGWVDRIQPHELMRNRIVDWGKYINGWLHQLTSADGVVEPTSAMLLVHTTDGRAMWYTGLRSRGDSGQGTMGFMLVDARTGEAEFYRRSGITEEAAQAALEGRVQEYGYSASAPIPYNVDGIPTFVSILKDATGNPQQIGMVAYDDRSTAVTGSNLDTTLRRYAGAVNDAGGSLAGHEGVEPVTVEGVVERRIVETIDDSTTLYFTLDAVDDTVFRTAATGQPGALLTQPGDRVHVSVMNLDAAEVSVQTFDNRTLGHAHRAPREGEPEDGRHE